ncbi:hypothetical protein [Pseudobdellovibrio exovorus]|nr:hypothetical protein [Pseudobdellovibrio exovorus]
MSSKIFIQIQRQFVLSTLFAATLFTSTAQALVMGALDTTTAYPEGNVILERPRDLSKNYRERRGPHGFIFGLGAERFYPTSYRSILEDAYFDDIVGSTRVNLYNVTIGYKYNFSAGSIGLMGNYAYGSIEGAVANVDRKVTISRVGIGVNYAMDALFDEPWIVPFIQGGVHQFSVSEADAAQSASATASMAMNYRAGLMFQLDWLENMFDDSARAQRLTSSGLQNTFIEIYFSEHLASSRAIDPADPSNEGDPNMYSTGEIGLGLKVEF